MVKMSNNLEEEIKKSKDLNIDILKNASSDIRNNINIKIKKLPFYKRWWRWLKWQLIYIKHKNNG